MYSTCLFCHADLGRNEVLEAFPVGRRLAYDAAKGRLWVVCRRCERWNLTPQEERWEAIEQAERLYGGTRLRAATDNIGLARLRDGTELVRIGAPLRPEFAAWRYGDQFGRRRLRRAGLVVTGSAVLLAVMFGGPVAGLSLGGGANVLSGAFQLGARWYRRRRVVTRLSVPDPTNAHRNAAQLRLALLHVQRTQIFPTAGAGWQLVVPHLDAGERIGYGWDGLGHYTPGVVLTGVSALQAAAKILPLLNRGGGSGSTVRTAVELLEQGGSAEQCFSLAARDARWQRERAFANPSAYRHALAALRPEVRLALEMAAHEEQERRALEGALGELERAWRDAEEIAAIADDLLLPAGLGDRLDQLKSSIGRSSARAGAASSPPSDSGSATSS